MVRDGARWEPSGAGTRPPPRWPRSSPGTELLARLCAPGNGAGGRGVSTLGNARCQLRPAAPKLRDEAPHPLFYF